MITQQPTPFSRPRAHGSTIAAAVLHFVTIAVAGGIVMVFFALAAFLTGMDESGRAGDQLGGVLSAVLIGFFLIACGGVALGIALIACRPWARSALIVLYALLTFGVLALAVSHMTSGGGSGLWLFPHGLLPPVVLALLLDPRTASDFRRI